MARKRKQSLEKLAEPITETVAKDVDHFWDLLAPENLTADLLYRGQSRASWKLQPSIFRFHESLMPSNDILAQVTTELRFLSRFIGSCDQIGLPIPNESEKLRRYFVGLENVHDWELPCGGLDTDRFPPDLLLPLMALAQHHRLPTRLLDWTRRSYVAAYFAAKDALCQGDDLDGNLSVWVVDATRIWNAEMDQGRIVKFDLDVAYPGVKIVETPGSNNKNIAAQAGVLTVIKEELLAGGTRIPPSQPTSLDDYFLRAFAEMSPKRRVPLSRVSVAREFAPGILRYCASHFINEAALFPDYYGAARAASLQMGFIDD